MTHTDGQSRPIRQLQIDLHFALLRRASALTMQTYGCKVDPDDADYSAKFDSAFEAVKAKLNSIEARRTVPKVFLLSSTRKIVTQVGPTFNTIYP